jgi:nucleolar protein 12
MKRNAKKDQGSRASSNGVYNPKVSEEQKSALGRASKLLGRAGAALQSRTNPVNANATPLSKTRLPSSGRVGEVKAPESFVFEGHRATPGSFSAGRGKKKDGKASGSKKKVGRPNNHATRRTKAWKLGGEK